MDYSQEVFEELKQNGFEVEIDRTDNSLSKKVRNAQLNQFNYIVVIVQEEVEERSINIRTRTGKPLGKQTTQEFI